MVPVAEAAILLPRYALESLVQLRIRHTPHFASSAAVALGLLTLVSSCDTTPPEEDAGLDAGPSDGGPPDAGDLDAGVDAGPPGDCEGPPGLYVEGSCDVLAAGVRAFHPQFVLWSDGADKDRFISIPSGEQIDTRDPDNWVFPVGTRVYKTFSHDGVRLETRLLEKTDIGTGPTAWTMRAFAWNADQDRVTDVTNEPAAIRENVLGTEHDIPSGSQCMQCHSGALDVVNGFSAIQLNHDTGGLTLEMLLDEGALSVPIAAADADVPGDATAVAALGYLHANCGHCHRFTEFQPDDACATPPCGTCNTPACPTGLHMWLRVADAALADTRTHATAVGVRGTSFPPAYCRVHPGEPETSTIVVRMGTRDTPFPSQMPPLGTEQVDEEGLALIETWIAGVTGDATACVP